MEVSPQLVGFTVGKTVLRGYWKVWENLALEIKKTNQRKNKNYHYLWKNEKLYRKENNPRNSKQYLQS